MKYVFVDLTDKSALLILAEAASQQIHADKVKMDEDKDADATLEQGAMDATTQDPFALDDITIALDDITIDPDALADLPHEVSELKAGSKDTGTAATQDPDRDPDATPTGK